MTAVKDEVPPEAAEGPLSEPVEGKRFRRFVWNLIAIVVLGVLISGWLVEFTDFFPTIGGLLGLGGIFAWIAFLSNLISENRKKQMQAAVEERLLLARATAAVALVLLVAFAIIAWTRGTIVIVGANDGQKRTVAVTSKGNTVATVDVQAGATTKQSFFVPRQPTFTLVTAGLPPLDVTLPHLGSTIVQIPQSFTAQPVILASMPSDLATSADGASAQVRIKRANSKWWVEYGRFDPGSYNGESIWVGCGADVAVPPSVKSDWATQPGATQPVQRRWSMIKSAGTAPLHEGDLVCVCVSNAGGGTMASGSATVLSPKTQPFPQLLQLTVSTETGCN